MTAAEPARANPRSLQNAAASSSGPDIEKLAVTQAAWLAALLVAFASLLTLVRLGKVRARHGK